MAIEMCERKLWAQRRNFSEELQDAEMLTFVCAAKVICGLRDENFKKSDEIFWLELFQDNSG
jgi:hypothetical protein